MVLCDHSTWKWDVLFTAIAYDGKMAWSCSVLTLDILTRWPWSYRRFFLYFGWRKAKGKAKKKQASLHPRIAERLRKLEAPTSSQSWERVGRNTGGGLKVCLRRTVFPVHAARQQFVSIRKQQRTVLSWMEIGHKA